MSTPPRQRLVVYVPPALLARLDALSAADPHGAPRARVAATALDRGVEVLERAAALGRGARGPALARGRGDGPADGGAA